MGLFDFFTGGGHLGEMVKVVAKSYQKFKSESESELNSLIGCIVLRYMFSPVPNREYLRQRALNDLYARLNSQRSVGLYDACYSIAKAENDIVGIEDHISKVIEKNLNKSSISKAAQKGRIYTEAEVNQAKEKFGLA